MQRTALYIILFFIPIGTLQAESCGGWTFRHPLPQGNDIEKVFFDGEQLWAVGKLGLIMTSSDGQDWAIQSSHKPENYQDITMTPWGLMIVGSDGVVLNSQDGSTWTEIARLPVDLYAIAYGNGSLVAVGAGDRIYVTTDLSYWGAWNKNSYQTFRDITFDGTLFVAVGYQGTLAVSFNGTSWTTTENLLGITKPLYGIEYLNERYIVTGEKTILSSPNLENWALRSFTLSITLKGSFWFQNQFVAFGNYILASPDAVTWNYAQAPTDYVLSACEMNSSVIAVGQNGLICSSTDGILWENHEGRLGAGTLNSITYGNGRFVTNSTNLNTLFTSLNGVDWEILDPGLNQEFRKVKFVKDTFVAIGRSGKIFTSQDGIQWQEMSSPTTVYMEDIATDGNRVVIVGNQVALYSDDLENWKLADLGGWSPWLHSVCYGWGGTAGRFVAVGNSGTILYSLDGQSWRQAASSGLVSNSLYCVVANGSHFLAVGPSGTLLTSLFGFTWFKKTPPVSDYFNYAFYDGEQYRVFSGDLSVISSKDLTTWEIADIPVWQPIYGALQVDSRLLLVGGHSTILEKLPLDLDWMSWPNPKRVTEMIDFLNNQCH